MLPVSKRAGEALLCLATSFCCFVEGHRSEFGILGSKKTTKTPSFIMAVNMTIMDRTKNAVLGTAGCSVFPQLDTKAKFLLEHL
ncbi:hypothetical protein PG984_016219 [Apiospora sp. TS-2023a]